MEEQTLTKPKRAWRRKDIHQVTPENDSLFRGPLSYRHFRIIGWALLVISQIGMILGAYSQLTNNNAAGVASTVFTFFSALPAPLFLIAAFSQILVAKDGYRRLIIVYVAGAVGIFLLFVVVYFHYLLGYIGAFGVQGNALELLIQLFSKNGYFCFNIFIDLILCAFLTLFINYRPTKHFQGKKIYIFRLFAIIPILYEVASILLKTFASNGMMFLPPIVYPLLTTKPPFAFFIFVIIAFFMKRREIFFIKKGKTYEDYARFTESNVNRSHFANFLIIMIVIASIIDIIAFTAMVVSKYNLTAEYLGHNPDLQQYIDVNAIINETLSIGFGKTVPMLLIIPLIFFYDYRKTYDNIIVDLAIPVIGIVFVGIAFVEGSFQISRLEIIKMIQEQTSEGNKTNEVSALLGNMFGSFIRF